VSRSPLTPSWKRIVVVAATLAASTGPVVLAPGSAVADAVPCAGTQFGTAPINGDGAEIGEVVVYRNASTWCVLTYHRNATVGVALPTTVEVTSPSGTTTLDAGPFEHYAGPGSVRSTTCPAGTAPCTAVTGSIVYRGRKYTSLPFYLVDDATDANPCGGTQVGSVHIKAGSTVIGEIVSYRLAPDMWCGLTYHRGPTVGQASYTELGVTTANGKGLVDSGTFRYYAGPGQVRITPSDCPPDTTYPCSWFVGGITYRGTLYVAEVRFQS
jgi:hypothetical protein